MSASQELAAAAARWVVDEGMEYPAAKRRAAREWQRQGGRRSPELPSNEAVEEAVREHLALFCADTQPGELRALREVARLWMQRLAPLRPHLAGAVWRGTATANSAVHIDLYCDDSKEAEITLVNAGVDFDVTSLDNASAEPTTVLTVASPSRALNDLVTVHLSVRDRDDQRGALKPDAQGRSWRGDLAALERLLDQEQ